MLVCMLFYPTPIADPFIHDCASLYGRSPEKQKDHHFKPDEPIDPLHGPYGHAHKGPVSSAQIMQRPAQSSRRFF